MAKIATQTKQQPKQPAPTSTAATLAALNSAPPVSSSAAQPVKKPPVVYSAGLAANAPANAPVVTIAGAPANGALPATTPINRGIPNNTAVTIPKQWHGAAMLGQVKPLPVGRGNACGVAFNTAVNALFATGAKQTPAAVYAALCRAASGGAQAHLGYIAKNGWLAPSK